MENVLYLILIVVAILVLRYYFDFMASFFKSGLAKFWNRFLGLVGAGLGFFFGYFKTFDSELGYRLRDYAEGDPETKAIIYGVLGALVLSALVIAAINLIYKATWGQLDKK